MAIETRIQEQEQFAKAKKLDDKLESSGAYEKIPDRRSARLIKVFLTTEATLAEAGETLEKPLRRTRVHELLYSGMRQAFPYLDEQTRQEYGSPETALKNRINANKAQHIKHYHAIAIQSYREGTYTGKPIGGARSRTGHRRAR